jgi:hypothetical protein
VTRRRLPRVKIAGMEITGNPARLGELDVSNVD